jgi:hypothetical protein
MKGRQRRSVGAAKYRRFPPAGEPERNTMEVYRLSDHANSFTRIQSVALVSRIVEMIGSNVKDPADRKRLLTALTQFSAEIAPAHQAIGAKG